MLVETIIIISIFSIISYVLTWEKFSDYVFLRECGRYSNNSNFYQVLNPKINKVGFEYQTDSRFNVSRINPIF